METVYRVAWAGASLAALIVVWQIAAAFADSRLLPAPGLVLSALVHATQYGGLLANLGITLARVLAAFVVAMVIGSAIGFLLGRSAVVNRLFGSWVILLLNLPALVVIMLCYVWFGLNEAAALLAVSVNKIPNVAVVLREGAQALDRDLSEMAEVYRLNRWQTLRNVVLPQLAPYFAASARTGLALVWKIVLVVELLGRSNGVGFELQTAFQLFDVATILAYALAFTAVVQLIELGIMQPWERAASRWRR